MLIVLAGLPASGKSVLAKRLQAEIDAVVLDKDKIRACLFSEHVEYQRRQDDLCVDVMYDVAGYHLSQRPEVPIILDGRTYSRQYQIDAVKAASARIGTPICFIECQCSSDTARLRLEKDRCNHIAQDRDYSLYLRSRNSAEPIKEPRLVLNTDRLDIETCLQKTVAYLEEQRSC